jgi:PAS domain S-box-containing protein
VTSARGEAAPAEQLRRIYDLALDLLGCAGFDGFFKELNAAWESTLGFTRDELLEMPFFELIHPDDREKTRAVMGRLATGEMVIRFENRYRTKDGSYRWLQWNGVVEESERLIYFCARDVTEAKAAEQRLKESEEKFRSIFENSPSAILLLNRDGRIVSINSVSPPVTLETVRGRTVYDLAHPEDAGAVRSAVEGVLRTGEPATYEARSFTPDDDARWYEAHVGALWRDGRIEGATLVASDITERKRLEQSTREALERARAAAEELTRKNELLEAEIAERERVQADLALKQRTILAMSAPIIRAWRGVLVLPLIGGLDAARAPLITDQLLAEIARTNARFAVLDLTGVHGVDPETAGHLVTIARAAGLLGSACLLSGISAAVARTLVEIDATLEGLRVFGELEDALRHAIARSGREAPAPRAR